MVTCKAWIRKEAGIGPAQVTGIVNSRNKRDNQSKGRIRGCSRISYRYRENKVFFKGSSYNSERSRANRTGEHLWLILSS